MLVEYCSWRVLAWSESQYVCSLKTARFRQHISTCSCTSICKFVSQQNRFKLLWRLVHEERNHSRPSLLEHFTHCTNTNVFRDRIICFGEPPKHGFIIWNRVVKAATRPLSKHIFFLSELLSFLILRDGSVRGLLAHESKWEVQRGAGDKAVRPVSR